MMDQQLPEGAQHSDRPPVCEESGKASFTSKGKAMQYAGRHYAARKARMRAYRCERCSYWHLTKKFARAGDWLEEKS